MTLEIRPAARLVMVDGVPVQLTVRQWDLVTFLQAEAGRAVPYEKIYREVWHQEPLAGAAATIKVTLWRIRQLTGLPITTLWGFGLRWDG